MAKVVFLGPGEGRLLVVGPNTTTLKAVTEGREVFLDVEIGGAAGFSSPLSLPYLLEELVPRFAAAVDGDPATPAE